MTYFSWKADLHRSCSKNQLQLEMSPELRQSRSNLLTKRTTWQTTRWFNNPLSWNSFIHSPYQTATLKDEWINKKQKQKRHKRNGLQTNLGTEGSVPSPTFSSQASTLTTMRHCADWWNVQRFESESSVQIKAIRFIWLQLTSLMTHVYPLLKETTT